MGKGIFLRRELSWGRRPAGYDAACAKQVLEQADVVVAPGHQAGPAHLRHTP